MFKKIMLTALTAAAIASTGAGISTPAAAGGYYYNRGAHAVSYWDQHVAWCHDRYRSYHAWDNSFQPYNGPRKLCFSPFWHG